MPKVETRCEVDVTVPMLAQWFAQLTDDEQAQFFVEASKWADANYTEGMMSHPCANADYQWGLVGNHLATCKCSTYRAREMVLAIFESMTAKPTVKP